MVLSLSFSFGTWKLIYFFQSLSSFFLNLDIEIFFQKSKFFFLELRH